VPSLTRVVSSPASYWGSNYAPYCPLRDSKGLPGGMARGMGHAEAGGYSVVLSRRRSCRGTPPRGSQRVAWEDRADHNPWAATRPPAAGKKRGRATLSGLLQARSHCNSCRGAAR
jgi:hypothetical protein